MEFMRDGGVAMWAVLAVAAAAGGAAGMRRQRDGWRIALLGAVGCLGMGLLGVSLGIQNTVAAAAHAEQLGTDAATLLSVGLRESVNNTIFGALCALLLLGTSVAVAPRGA